MTTTRRPSSGFVHLHVRSEHSHLYGASRLDELIQAARALGYRDLALTDRNGLYGSVAFYRKCREAGLTPILGVELSQPGHARDAGGRDDSDRDGGDRDDIVRGGSPYPPRPSQRLPAVTLSEAKGLAVGTAKRQRPRRDSSLATLAQNDSQPATRNGDRSPRGDRAVLLARNIEGYRTLCRLTTARHLNADFGLADAIAADHADVYVLVPDARLLADLAGRLPQGRLFALVEEFGDRSTRLRTDGLARAAGRRQIPLVAGGAVAFHAPGRFAAHRTLRAIATLTTVADVPRGQLAHPKAILAGPEAMAARFRRWPEAVANTVRIAADCRLDLVLGRPVFPRAAIPAGETPYSHLAKLAFAGLKTRYRPLRPEAVGRLENELAVIDRLGFADYFLILHEIVAWTRGQGIPCVARGSAAGSLVAYALGLSGVDPLRYGLLFERFLNLERADCPDIDIDICWRSRDRVIRHVYETHGSARVAMISTHQSFQAKSAFREVAKAHGLPPEEVDRLSRRLPYYSAAGIPDAVVSFPELRDFPLEREDIARVLEVAAVLDGFPRHLSVHVGGLVIADRPLTDYLPLQVAAKGIVITQYEADAVEAMGLVKMDLLAQRSISILATAVREIEKNHGVRVDPEALADGDPAAADLLARGDTFGCFQIESPGMRNLLKMMGARRRMDVILGLSLIRPGPASSGMKERFVRRRRGLEPAEYLHPALRDVLGDTYGIMLYQEDVIRVAHAAAGFTLAEGDRLRKDLAKGVAPAAIETWRTRFVRGAIARGARRTDAETLWDRVAQFAAYSYCKAHAATYGEIAYRAVCLRARWPAEFAAAVLANQAGYYERRTYIEDARRHGCPILGPDVNASAVEPSTEWVTPTQFSRDPAGSAPGRRVGVRVGLMDVRGLSQRAMQAIVASRESGGPYRSAADLLARVHLAREEAENLALTGALDSIAVNRPAALWQVHALAGGRPAGAPLFDGAAASAPCPDLEDYGPLRKLELEDHLLGMTPSANPMAVYRRLTESPPSAPLPGPATSSPTRKRRAIPTCRMTDLPNHLGTEVTVA
ncbi:MAG TPA: DNA polymerase III subunit alpha, partial [Phycisphaerae bacterium]|nr:DNA polymerase III subunit alpha [Phycisphaerae bacterium]